MNETHDGGCSAIGVIEISSIVVTVVIMVYELMALRSIDPHVQTPLQVILSHIFKNASRRRQSKMIKAIVSAYLEVEGDELEVTELKRKITVSSNRTLNN